MTLGIMIVLGIETSCDETAAAVVAEDRRILSNVALSQLDEHHAYGGVVPEIGARAHLKHLNPLIRQRSEEHTSELQTLMRISYAFFCLKKKIQPKEFYRIPNADFNTFV